MMKKLLEKNGNGKKDSSLVTSLANGRKSNKFGFDDLAQQIVGAFIFSAPFLFSQEVWELANMLDPFKMLILIVFTIFVSSLIIYYTKFQKIEVENIGKTYIPKRLFSLLVISYLATTFVLWLFGIIGYITDPYWTLKLIIFISFFASLGGATVDILK